MARTPNISPDTLLEALAAEPSGVGIDDLERKLGGVPRRTLQRHLADLTAAGHVEAEGKARARVYRLLTRSPRHPDDTDGIQLSAAAREIRAYVQRPLHARAPTGYDRAMLDAYIPNGTTYLPASLRRELHRLGRSPAETRPAGTYARQIIDRLLIDLSWASSRLEGNTYSRLDTQNLIQFGQVADGKDQLEAQMILNHKAAIEMLVDQAEEIGFNAYTVKNLHALLSENLLPDPASGGRLRSIDVQISHSVYQPTAIPQVIDECFRTLLAKAEAVEDPFEQAFFAMVHLPYLQPFDDVNRRTSRLAANIPLIRGNLVPLSFVDVPQDLYVEGTLGVYETRRMELLRDVFAWAYARSCQRYAVLRDALPTPDPVRLKHRETLRALVPDVIGNAIRRDDVVALRREVERIAEPADVDELLSLLINELHQLHEGNIARYRLRPAVFRAWLAGGDPSHAGREGNSAVQP